MTEKILGYILLGLGIMTIIYSGLNVYAVFTKQTQPVKLFNFKGIGLDTSQILATSLPPEAAQFLKQNPDKPAPSEIISAELINDTSNIFVFWSNKLSLNGITSKLLAIHLNSQLFSVVGR